MPDPALLSRSALDGIAHPGRHGLRTGTPGLLLREVTGTDIVGIAVRRNQEAVLADAVMQGWGVQLPSAPRVAEGRGVAFLWSGPGRWLALAETPSVPESLEAGLRRLCDSSASFTAQGDGRVVLRLSGPAVREVLASVVPIDLHPRVFRAGDTAMTLANHLAVQLRQVDDAPCFELLGSSSTAGSLFETVLHAGERFGVEVLPPGPP